MSKQPTKPGHYYAIIDGQSTIVRVDECMGCWHGTARYGADSVYIQWLGEAVPTVDQARETRRQIEFLEWMAEAASDKRLRIRTRTSPCAGTHISGPRGRLICAWAGSLRDGWRHWGKIKEAVK